MKITSQQELEALIVNHEIVIQESVEFTFSFSVDVSIRVAGDIKAWDIKAWDINARDINARDIKAWDIKARDISFFAVCVAYVSLKCKSLVGRRGNAKFLCLDSLPIIEAASKEEKNDTQV